MVRPGLATVRTLSAESVWNGRMELRFQEDAASFATKLRWRRSFHGGRVIAQPAATARQLAVSKRLAGQPPAAQRCLAEVATAGTDNFDPAEVARAIMTIVQAELQGLQEIPATAVSEPGQWQQLASSASQGPARRLRIHLHNADQIIVLQRLLHERVLKAGDELVTVLVVTEEQTFAGKGARGRAGPLTGLNSA